MTRSIVIALFAALGVATLSSGGCAPTGVGDPCTPEQEFDPTFPGFDFHEVSTESKSFQCQTRVCLVNHFQGRVSCPYGQDAMGKPPSGALTACVTPGIAQPVTGPLDANNQPTDQTIKPQCTTRTAADAVYCSCRCANINGATDDGAVYCACPDGYTCTQLVSAIESSSAGAMAQNEGLTGAYCIKNGTQFNPSQGCPPCDPNQANQPGGCGTAQGAGM